MTEEEWQECEEPTLMLNFVRRKTRKVATERKLRLFAVACVRRVEATIAWEDGRKAIEVAERYADQKASKEELRASQKAAIRGTRVRSARYYGPHVPAAERRRRAALAGAIKASGKWEKVPHAAECAVELCSRRSPHDAVSAGCSDASSAARFVPYRVRAGWLTSTVLPSRRVYESRDFSAMPILADALQDAGCDNDDVLNHCRGPGPHVRGCWVVDLVLGME